MIPDFPEIKKQYHQLMKVILKDMIDENSPMTREASKKINFEGDKMGILRENGEYEVSEMRKVSVEIEFSYDEIIGLTDFQILDKFNMAAKTMAKQVSQTILDKVDEAIVKTGNIIASPDGLTPEWINEALKKIHITFEDDDPNKPCQLSFFASPQVIDRFQEYYASLSQLDKDNYNKEYNEIMKVKFQEHLQDLNERKLIIS